MIATDIDSQAILKKGFQALSDSIRLEVLDLLRHQELCVCDLLESIEVSQSKLSFHLKTLKEAGLVRSRQDGRWVYYSLNLPQLVALEQYLSDFRRTVSLSNTPKNSCCD
ncbi:MAG: winged helix-turn-helix transcriptional regulator [Cyanobacterium sp. T60_A2020_053]|nr:winged helix-turn-helix transcriptional regulator [Cyanobacterium sp. T60_A2020_053]